MAHSLMTSSRTSGGLTTGHPLLLLNHLKMRNAPTVTPIIVSPSTSAGPSSGPFRFGIACQANHPAAQPVTSDRQLTIQPATVKLLKSMSSSFTVLPIRSATSGLSSSIGVSSHFEIVSLMCHPAGPHQSKLRSSRNRRSPDRLGTSGRPEVSADRLNWDNSPAANAAERPPPARNGGLPGLLLPEPSHKNRLVAFGSDSMSGRASNTPPWQ